MYEIKLIVYTVLKHLASCARFPQSVELLSESTSVVQD